jgi:GcrA cell cycle regulator
MNPWPVETIDTLKRLIAEGLTFSQIGARLGKSRNAVIGKAHREGLSGTSDYKKCHKPARPGGRVPKARKLKPWRELQVRKSAAVFENAPFIPGPELVIPLKERKGILDLGENDCRWPIGDPQKADFHFCNRCKVPGLPYCETHARRAFLPPGERRKSHGNYVPANYQRMDSTVAVDALVDREAPINTREKQDA